ncbi:hypothetical protein HOY82DRAFT_573432, partial [Tuber indicum]
MFLLVMAVGALGFTLSYLWEWERKRKRKEGEKTRQADIMALVLDDKNWQRKPTAKPKSATSRAGFRTMPNFLIHQNGSTLAKDKLIQWRLKNKKNTISHNPIKKCQAPISLLAPLLRLRLRSMNIPQAL